MMPPAGASVRAHRQATLERVAPEPFPLERERGVAHRLLADVERLAREEGVSFLEVTAGHHRPEARQLFESLGYDASVTAYLRKRP